MFPPILPNMSLEIFPQSVEMGYHKLCYFREKNLLPNIPYSLGEFIVMAHFPHLLKETKETSLCALHSFENSLQQFLNSPAAHIKGTVEN